MLKSISKTLICLLITAIVGFISFYIFLPALNFQSEEFYIFIAFLCGVYIFCSLFSFNGKVVTDFSGYFNYMKKKLKITSILLLLLLAIFIIGQITSLEIFRASSYRNLIKISEGNFAEDVNEISFDKIPMLDKDSAMRLGDRKLGELADMVSQFEVASNYTQINFNDRPVRVTPLVYGDTIKWLTNQSKGIPAYIILDMATQEAEVVRVNSGIKYSQSEIFNRNINRYIRFKYPTFMFDTPNFEIDEEGNPYWICPKIEKRIGLFGGTDINGAVLVNAVTGETEYLEKVPEWVDRLYSSDIILQQYDYYGMYVNGFLNSIFGQRDVTVTTEGHNYIALNDDVYMYTGITSVGSDQSNVGFILSNQRTKETKYYPCAGATEYSAMASAKGIVQHLNYKATFPLLLNISSEPTYFMALKDNAELVKLYSMVNVGQYQIVSTGSNPEECKKEYIRLMKERNIVTEDTSSNTLISGKIVDIRSAVKEGTSYYYIKLENNPNYFVISTTQYEPVVTLNIGDSVEIEHSDVANENLFGIYSLKKI